MSTPSGTFVYDTSFETLLNAGSLTAEPFPLLMASPAPYEDNVEIDNSFDYASLVPRAFPVAGNGDGNIDLFNLSSGGLDQTLSQNINQTFQDALVDPTLLANPVVLPDLPIQDFTPPLDLNTVAQPDASAAPAHYYTSPLEAGGSALTDLTQTYTSPLDATIPDDFYKSGMDSGMQSMDMSRQSSESSEDALAATAHLAYLLGFSDNVNQLNATVNPADLGQACGFNPLNTVPAGNFAYYADSQPLATDTVAPADVFGAPTMPMPTFPAMPSLSAPSPAQSSVHPSPVPCTSDATPKPAAELSPIPRLLPVLPSAPSPQLTAVALSPAPLAHHHLPTPEHVYARDLGYKDPTETLPNGGIRIIMLTEDDWEHLESGVAPSGGRGKNYVRVDDSDDERPKPKAKKPKAAAAGKRKYKGVDDEVSVKRAAKKASKSKK